VTVQIRGDCHPMRARTATDTERVELCPGLVGLYSDYDSYESWTDRDLPVVLLEPTAG